MANEKKFESNSDGVLFALESVAHLQGREADLLPLVEAARNDYAVLQQGVSNLTEIAQALPMYQLPRLLDLRDEGEGQTVMSVNTGLTEQQVNAVLGLHDLREVLARALGRENVPHVGPADRLAIREIEKAKAVQDSFEP